jgi:hypothetical protein
MRVLQVLVCAGVLTIVACDNAVNISPTAPQWTNIAPVGSRSLQISGSLTAERGSCLEATILYDGRELADARATCPYPGGCAELELAATTPSSSGHHTISFQILRQSQEFIAYLAEGTVVVSREGLPLGGVTLSLGPAHAKLRSGGVVTFDLEFRD